MGVSSGVYNHKHMGESRRKVIRVNHYEGKTILHGCEIQMRSYLA